jgi:endonuclease/exonuclease/phosphatase family metal-dependent hydrolase
VALRAKKKKRRKSRISLLARIALLVNILVALGLLLSYVGLYISPEAIWVLPFMGLIYPYLLLINILFGVYWLIRFRIYFTISLVAVLIGWNLIGRTIQVDASTEPLPYGNSLLVMTYNVRNMANNNMLQPDYEIRDAIVDLLKVNQPDLLCLQEFESRSRPPVAFIDSLSEMLGLPYYSYVKYNEDITKRINAIITFSRFPILHSHAFKKDKLHNYCLVNDILVYNDTLRLFNIHLESVRFKQEDYTFINDLDLQFEEDENIKEGSRSVISKLKRAYIVRSAQVKNLRNSLLGSPYPVILCGDFNDTPCSYSYQVLAKGKKDAFMESGSGLGNTYAGTLPSLRIDYILYDPFFRSFTYTTGRERLSDHYPVAARIGHR